MRFNHPCVRDLAWALGAPPLLEYRGVAPYWPDQSWYVDVINDFANPLHELDSDPSPLLDFIATRQSRRLGIYFESLWLYWLQHNARYQLLHANLAVHAGGKTLGEFDFIVRDRDTDQTLHWEVAVKFYLGIGDTEQPVNWWGPQRRDRLDIKLDHLLSHQTRLSQQPEARDQLQALGIHIDERWVILKGRLFYPAGIDALPPLDSHVEHQRGFWLPESELHKLPDNANATWKLLDRSEWFAPVAEDASSKLIPSAQLNGMLFEVLAGQPICIARIENGIETARGFLVPDDWSNHSAI